MHSTHFGLALVLRLRGGMQIFAKTLIVGLVQSASCAFGGMADLCEDITGARRFFALVVAPTRWYADLCEDIDRSRPFAPPAESKSL